MCELRHTAWLRQLLRVLSEWRPDGMLARDTLALLLMSYRVLARELRIVSWRSTHRELVHELRVPLLS